MYKFIIGNVKVSVLADTIDHDQATEAAKQAIAAAGAQGKMLSQIKISAGESGLEIETTARIGARSIHKNIKQSLLDGIEVAIGEKLYPTGAFAQKEYWLDNETGQEWRGTEVDTARTAVLKDFKIWLEQYRR